MEPESTAPATVAELPERWRNEDEHTGEPDEQPCAHCTAEGYAGELEASLAMERKPHEEMAREVARQIYDCTDMGATNVEIASHFIVRALASAVRAERGRCPVTGAAHEWETEYKSPSPEDPQWCARCEVLRSAVEPQQSEGAGEK